MAGLGPDRIENAAEPANSVGVERGVVADVEAEEVDVVDDGKEARDVDLGRSNAGKVRLAKLISAAGVAAAVFDAVGVHGCDQTVAEGWIGVV